MPWCSEGSPRNVEPARAGEELVGVFTSAEEVDKALELARVLGADVSSLAKEVLRVLDATDEDVDARVAEAGGDEDGTDQLSGGLQEHQAAIDHVHHVLHGGLVVGVLIGIDEFCQRKVITEFGVFH